MSFLFYFFCSFASQLGHKPGQSTSIHMPTSLLLYCLVVQRQESPQTGRFYKPRICNYWHHCLIPCAHMWTDKHCSSGPVLAPLNTTAKLLKKEQNSNELHIFIGLKAYWKKHQMCFLRFEQGIQIFLYPPPCKTFRQCFTLLCTPS